MDRQKSKRRIISRRNCHGDAHVSVRAHESIKGRIMKGSRDRDAQLAFGELVRIILVSRGRNSLREAASKLGMTVDQLDSRLRGHPEFAPEEIVSLIREVSDERRVGW